ncbi:hypothetical protein EV663_1079 [Rhodovulum bhavnagarense]|uniref:Dihydroorotate dehydrogenase n=1 Tax=Rhodovulum bhavnagarense TaxID=992286 RepID=A0A4R2RNR5_9RHOB|nr:dihydroorotate dehydrogenase [Rhodovulum bhavnagarense]TCP60835.1 hypothetical protein EV663_1079 [Rhodovulum bhavnagarense]
MTERTEITDEALEALFQVGRDTGPAPSAALLARVMDDAMAEAGVRAAPLVVGKQTPTPATRRGVIGAMLSTLGGWPSMAGLASATVAGIWIGYADPAALDIVTTVMLGGGYEPVDLVPSLDTFLQEG